MIWRKALRVALVVAIAFALLGLGTHVAIGRAARMTPPHIEVPAGTVQQVNPSLRRFQSSYAVRRGKLLEVGLEGTPEEIGYAHARLLYDQMVENEGILFGRFREQVSFAPARWLLLDLAQWRYRDVNRGMSAERRREIAAGARGFQPDPYTDIFPTFQRFVYLNALYDISLSFEHSPLIGCTSFAFSGDASETGHTLLARAFDFEVDSVFDERKAVFFVREAGRIPFASVAWPGLVGVVSGMNSEGLALVVHGGRAGEPRTRGEPVVHALRRVLSSARTTDEAIVAFAEQTPLVSHIIVAADAHGHLARIERIPGRPVHAARLPERAAVTNHFEGPAAADPKNARVREHTSTLPRRQRADALLASNPAHSVAVEDAVRLLRDRRSPSGQPLGLGDRRAIDALIATHGVVFDTTARVLWVSESPHLLGRFVAFDLKRHLAESYDPDAPGEFLSIPADPLLTSGQYAKFAAARGE
ncbi:MAG TPA: C45 family peptidase [Polyangiaceae bacterium]|nr:C45 family peptidase [Polyangiaceae bacterium]